ncbi:MAG: bifunctional 2-polyprenyl-6-hydroxyphenol methylase/3-demethylubiquinol 3-O-methyltransferase UbiG [Alphaproteobacteria bacterium]|nr:bifunctional 2-polyprenyl-6-hydroxyphenol methylase/3-demethylubiquinol 3-O-methyltransferase UbiG [Alphaproteobacteria bacterium]
MTPSPAASLRTTIDPDEVDKFARLAETWWDPDGPFRPLHRLNPVRLEYIRSKLIQHFGRDSRSFLPFDGLRLLDLGCGGGLLAEPMARLGFTVVGADAAAENVRVARHHAANIGLAIDYVHSTAEELAQWGERFDAILALEVVEHVSDVGTFAAACATMLKPGGALVLSTLNRTLRSYALGVVAAEYLLRWVPVGTHDWNKFLRPSELARALRGVGLELSDLTGMSFSPRSNQWRLTDDLTVNYLGLATRSRA